MAAENQPVGRSGVVSKTPTDPKQIVQETTVGSTPPMQGGIPARPGKRIRTTTNTTDEYTSAGGYGWYANYPRSLPWAIDDITRDFGDSLYDRMMLDGKVASLANDYRAAVLEDGLRLLPAIDDEDDPHYEDAQKLMLWCQDILDNLETPLTAVLWDLCEAIISGNRVAELVWRVGQDMNGDTALLLDAIKVKPRHAISFVCDAYFNILGVLALMPGMMTVIQPDLLITDLDKIPSFLPREKFVILTFRMRDSDPRGQSILRAAYNAWNLKMQVWPEYLKYLVQFASPSVWGTTPPESEQVFTDAAGNTLTGQASDVSPETAMANQLLNMRNGSIVVFPSGAEVTTVQSQGTGEAFQQAIDLFDRQMASAILGQTLATEEGKHQTRASSGTHTDIKDMLVRLFKPVVEHTIRADVLRTLVRYNKPTLLKYLPKVTLAAPEEADFGTMAGGVAALEREGYLGKSQRTGIDRKLGLPPRDEQEDAEDEAKEAAALAPPPLPAPAAGAATEPPAAPQAGGPTPSAARSTPSGQGSSARPGTAPGKPTPKQPAPSGGKPAPAKPGRAA